MNERNKMSIEKLISYKKDFADIDQYTKEIEYLEPLIKNVPDLETIKKDQEAMKILSSNYTIKVSQYTFEILMALTEKNHYKSIESLFFNYSKSQPQLIVVSDLKEQKELLTTSNLHIKLSKDSIKSVNDSEYKVGLNKRDYEFFEKLDSVYKKTILSENERTGGSILKAEESGMDDSVMEVKSRYLDEPVKKNIDKEVKGVMLD